MHIHIITTGFGQPHLEKKIEIARQNREKYNQCSHQITSTAYIYDDSPVPDGVFDHVVRKRGYVGQFIYGMDKMDPVYDRIMLILDDIEWVSDVGEFISTCEAIMEGTGRENGIFQPSLIDGSEYSHHHMLMMGVPANYIDTNFHRSKCFEYFCYYMTPKTFERYRSILGPDTRCMWGLDFIVPQRIPCFLFERFKIRHWFRGGMLNWNECAEEMHRVYEKFP